jgi:signal transduction histidine kinase/DNA-binding response OmpR family regulator
MILIVDDNQENIFSLKALLELNQFVVHTATSGKEALKCVLKNSYSLIILDVQMPEMDGFEVAEAISGYSKSKDTPIIFLSAINTRKEYIALGYKSGGVDYVTKPFDADVLLLKVKTFYRLSEQKRKLIEMDQFLRAEIEYRKKAESDLEQKVEELKSTLESMPQTAFTLCELGNIEFVNNHWSTYSSDPHSFPETEGINLQHYVHLAIAAKKQYIAEVKMRRLSETTYRFHTLYLTPVLKDGRIIRWVGVLTDIHEQKTVSQLLEKKVEERTRELIAINKKLESRNVELQRFAFVASHDLQEPLRKIQIFSDMVLRKFTDDKVSAEKFLQKIILSAERMRVLIRSLLDYSRLPDKDLYEPSDINAILKNVLQDLELEVQEKNARVVLEKIPLLDVIPAQMSQVFYNLISNSLKFSRDGIPPAITLRAELVPFKKIDAPAVADGDFCRITIADNGIGFDQTYADKIFEIFQRLNQRHGDNGAGIGLAIVKKIIDRHDGVVAVSAREGEGAVFTIVLPVKQRPHINQKYLEYEL